MLTQCPQCSTVYRVLAAQLAAANGFVTCGECASVFNALNRLADETSAAPSAARDAPTRAAATDGSEEPVRPVASEAREVAITPVSSATTAPARTTDLDLDEVPEILREDVARLLRRRRFSWSWGWSLVASLALFALVTQVAWQYRAWWSDRYPQLVPYAERICASLGCRVSPPLAVRGIELVARDVREHPQYAHALLVNATLANRNATAAAYPIIQLGVYDRTGGVVGIRRFAPREYLDASIDITRGMPAGAAVFVVFEIAGAGDVADSFEFTFL